MHRQKFLLVSIMPHSLSDHEALIDLKELKALVESYGGEVVDLVTQHREVHDKGPYIGSGKITEVGELIAKQQIDTVVLNAIIHPGHLYDMKNSWFKQNPQIEVWDRVDLILHIFSRHAHTAEARLQIELAAMRHMGPRIYGMGHVLSRQGGSIGTRGVGETNTELMKRHWREQIKQVKDKLKKLAADRERLMQRRERIGLKTVSLIGYTNAGKTSLFNRLTGKKKYVKNELFATLDASVGKLYLPQLQEEILISDTIGFIRNLPTKLIDAFKSTLMESLHADLLLHVIDSKDPAMETKIEIVEKILQELRIADKKQIYIFNKSEGIDFQKIIQIREKYRKYAPLFISVKTGKGIEELLATLGNILPQA
jgi:GTP-binding protein HflX